MSKKYDKRTASLVAQRLMIARKEAVAVPTWRRPLMNGAAAATTDSSPGGAT
jgi:hypothetical protein